MERKLYYNGTILTMEPELYAQAVLTEGPRIAAVGSLEDVQAVAAGALPIDLEGQTLMPAFIDAHSHFSGCANALLQCSVEQCGSFKQMVAAIAQFIRERRIKPGQWVLVRDFDEGAMEEAAHPDRSILDQASAEHPIVLQYRSGHVGVLNSMALQRFGIDEAAEAPEGGRIEMKDGSVTGYLEENAFIQILHRLPGPTLDEFAEAIRQVQTMYASYGITTVQEGMMVSDMIPMYQYLCRNHALWLDVTGYAAMDDAKEIFNTFKAHDGVYDCHFKLGGYKIFLDGSPQSRTAWVRTPYLDGSCGYPTQTLEAVTDSVRTAALHGRQILAHCNGDAAAAQYMEAISRVNCQLEADGKDGSPHGVRCVGELRPVLVHGQFLGTDQLAQVKALGVIPSFFVAHVYHWGDTHIKNLGLSRASLISPAASAGRAGLRYTFHQDSPVIRPDMAETLWCASNRRTRDGALLGPKERISVLDALKAVTCNSAYQYFEESVKGTLAPGKLADMIILRENPLDMPPERINTLEVMETIKEGQSVYRR